MTAGWVGSSHGSMAMTPWVRIIIVNYNGAAVLQRCLDALSCQTMGDFEAVIVDNGSTDASLTAVRLPDRRFRWLMAGQNLGFAAGNNRGAEGGLTPWLATLNPDAFPEPAWLERLREATLCHADVGMFGSTQIDAENPQRLDGCGDVCSALGIPWRGGYRASISTLPADGEAFAPCAAAALYRRDLFEAAGGFDESFFCYLEDVDLAYRLRLMGQRCLQLSSARVHHLGSAISGRASFFTLFHSYRNRLWLVFKNSPFPLILLLLPLHLAATVALLVWTRNIHDVTPCLRGVGAGLVGLPAQWSSRRRVQRQRIISNFRVFRALTWSLCRLRQRSIDLRPR